MDDEFKENLREFVSNYEGKTFLQKDEHQFYRKMLPNTCKQDSINRTDSVNKF